MQHKLWREMLVSDAPVAIQLWPVALFGVFIDSLTRAISSRV